ncbi:MAG: hypothetical protein WA112_10815 [Rugosibacter sp.]|jgi:hypothetical protein
MQVSKHLVKINGQIETVILPLVYQLAIYAMPTLMDDPAMLAFAFC